MSFNRPIRGGCHCGRNLYMIQLPADQPATQTAQIIFHPHPSHRSTLGTPLPAYLRVPLQYYRATALPRRADETSAMIHRAYDPPGAARHDGAEKETEAEAEEEKEAGEGEGKGGGGQGHTRRYFCGFCGTPLSFWSESPRAEADFICLTLGSLLPEDLADLEEMGLLAGLGLPPRSPSPSSSSSRAAAAAAAATAVPATTATAGTRGGGEEEGVVGSVGVLSWLDTLTEGSMLGELLRQARGGAAVPRGRVRVEWEIAEWSGDDDGGGVSPRKRKAEEVEGVAEGGRMEGIA